MNQLTGLPYTTITKVWQRIRTKAGLPKLRIHHLSPQSDNQTGRRPLNTQIFSTVLFLSLATTVEAENRIYQTDKYGTIEFNKPSYTVQENGRIVETDKYGNKQYHKDQQQIQGNKIYQTDKFGNIQTTNRL